MLKREMEDRNLNSFIIPSFFITPSLFTFLTLILEGI